MRRGVSLVVPLLGILCITAHPSRARARDDLLAEVPRGHWAYGIAHDLERRGLFTGYPPGAFLGRRPLARYEFSVAVHQMMMDFVGSAHWGGPLRMRVIRKLGGQAPDPHSCTPGLLRLVREFRVEIGKLGGDPEAFIRDVDPRRAVERAADPIQNPDPGEKALEVSARERARDEWRSGKVVLYIPTTHSQKPSIDPVLGIPFRLIGGCIAAPPITLVTAHNEEVYRLCLRSGLPSNARRGWLKEIVNPSGVWASGRPADFVLDPDHPACAPPDQNIRLALREPEGSRDLLIEMRSGDQQLTQLLWGLDPARKSLEGRWGPPGSELLFLRYPTVSGGRRGWEHRVVDVLLLVFLNALAEGPPAPGRLFLPA